MNFTKFILKNHPDPDSLLGQNYEQMSLLAEKYGESLQSLQSCVIPRSFFVFVQIGTDEYKILEEGIDTYDEAKELRNIYKSKFKNPPFVVASLNEV